MTCIGNGNTTSLWFDYWLPDGKRINDIPPPLRNSHLQGHSGMQRSQGSSKRMEDGWNFPSSIQAFQAIWNAIPFQPGPHMEDHHVWKGNPSGQFTIDSAWELLRETRPANTIHHLLWF